jgi:hypothetical protein
MKVTGSRGVRIDVAMEIGGRNMEVIDDRRTGSVSGNMIVGTVTDRAGAVLPGVDVTVRRP